MTAFANGFSARAMPGSRRLGERFQWRRVPPVSVYFMPGSIHRGAFFPTVEVQKDSKQCRCEQVSPSSTVLPQNGIKLIDVSLSEYLQGGNLSSSIGI